MGDFPKDGSTFVVEAIDRTAFRWAKYKPQGAKQMGQPGRWQKQVWIGDWFKWENCEVPVGELSPPIEDGPISKAFKQADALDHWRQEVGKLHSQIAAKDAEIAKLREVLIKADEAIAYYVRYLDGGETRGSYDGKPERDGLRKAGYATSYALKEQADA